MSASAAWRPIRSSSAPAARPDLSPPKDRAGTRDHACIGAFGPRFCWLPQRRPFACAARSRRSRRVRGLTEGTLFPSRMTRDAVRAFRLAYSPMRLQAWPIPPRTEAPAAIPRRISTFRCRAISPTPDVRPALFAASTSPTVPRNASPNASAQRRPAKSSITAVLSAKLRASSMTALSPGPKSHACTSAEHGGAGRTASQSSAASARAVGSPVRRLEFPRQPAPVSR